MADQTTPPSMIDEDLEERNIVPLPMLGKAVWLMVKIVLPLVIGAVVVGFMFFNLKTAIFAVFMGFCLMLFIALPLVLATYEDEVIGHGD